MTDSDAHAVSDGHAASYADTNPVVEARADYEWPMVEALLPAVDGRRVLDAGTGAGHYAALLAERGADLVGIDASEGVVDVARDCHGGVATFCRADLRDPLPFGGGAFDLVLCQLTLEHLRNRDPVAGESARVPHVDGRRVLSTDHPVRTYLLIEHEPPEIGAADDYAVERYNRDWGDDDDPLLIPFYLRPLRVVLRPWFDAGFVLEDFREPPPETDDERLGYFDAETPPFIGFRARLFDD